MLASAEASPSLFGAFFGLSIIFYIIKLCHNIYTYKKHLARVTQELENYYSDGSVALLRWINNTFYMVLTIGVVSVVVPLTNYTVLTLYNIFLFFAYLYIYIEIVRNIYLFDYSIAAMKDPGYSLPSAKPTDTKTETAEELSSRRQETYEVWLARRSFAIPGITADEIARQFGTNRTKLSLYLKKELGTNFYEWIARLRIEDAKRQLIEYPDRPVCDIAVNVGIDDKSNFGRLFKRFVGVSPAAYRSKFTSSQIS